MKLWLLFISGAVVFSLLPFAFLPPAEAIRQIPWAAPAGVFAAALVFKSYAYTEMHGIDRRGGSADE